jgi:hypothetical protein
VRPTALVRAQDWRRVNVALTRAKAKLLIIGDVDTLMHGAPVLSNCLKLCKQNQWVTTLPPNAHLLYACPTLLRDVPEAPAEASPTAAVTAPSVHVVNGGFTPSYVGGASVAPLRDVSLASSLSTLPSTCVPSVASTVASHAAPVAAAGEPPANPAIAAPSTGSEGPAPAPSLSGTHVGPRVEGLLASGPSPASRSRFKLRSQTHTPASKSAKSAVPMQSVSQSVSLSVQTQTAPALVAASGGLGQASALQVQTGASAASASKAQSPEQTLARSRLQSAAADRAEGPAPVSNLPSCVPQTAQPHDVSAAQSEQPEREAARTHTRQQMPSHMHAQAGHASAIADLCHMPASLADEATTTQRRSSVTSPSAMDQSQLVSPTPGVSGTQLSVRGHKRLGVRNSSMLMTSSQTRVVPSPTAKPRAMAELPRASSLHSITTCTSNKNSSSSSSNSCGAQKTAPPILGAQATTAGKKKQLGATRARTAAMPGRHGPGRHAGLANAPAQNPNKRPGYRIAARAMCPYHTCGYLCPSSACFREAQGSSPPKKMRQTTLFSAVPPKPT